jgi:alpha-glucuronidase
MYSDTPVSAYLAYLSASPKPALDVFQVILLEEPKFENLYHSNYLTADALINFEFDGCHFGIAAPIKFNDLFTPKVKHYTIGNLLTGIGINTVSLKTLNLKLREIHLIDVKQDSELGFSPNKYRKLKKMKAFFTAHIGMPMEITKVNKGTGRETHLRLIGLDRVLEKKDQRIVTPSYESALST